MTHKYVNKAVELIDSHFETVRPDPSDEYKAAYLSVVALELITESMKLLSPSVREIAVHLLMMEIQKRAIGD